MASQWCLVHHADLLCVAQRQIAVVVRILLSGVAVRSRRTSSLSCAALLVPLLIWGSLRHSNESRSLGRYLAKTRREGGGARHENVLYQDYQQGNTSYLYFFTVTTQMDRSDCDADGMFQWGADD